MPRYFFDTTDNRGFNHDGVGDDFDSFDEALEQCQGLLLDIICEELLNGILNTVTCDVRDVEDRVVYRGKLTYEGRRDA